MSTGSGVTIRLRWLLLALVFAIAGGAVLAMWLAKPENVMETPAPAEVQADGSVKLGRQPDPAAKPKHHIPRDAKVERIAQVKVQPSKPSPEAGKPCPPVTVDMTLIREKDGGRRVLASSPDGQVVGGIDVPIEPMMQPPASRKWAAGLSIEPVRQTFGAWVDRDVDIPLVDLAIRIGIELNQTRVQTSAPDGIEGRVRLGIAF